MSSPEEVYGLATEQLAETKAAGDAVERWHSDHHTGPFEMCWEGVCAYANGFEHIAHIHAERVSA